VTTTASTSGEAAVGDPKISPAARKGRVAEFDASLVRDLSEHVYRDLLEMDNSEGAVDRMIEKDGDNGEKLRERAGSYDRLSRAYLRAMKGTAS
jgi:hypothetical protein